MSIMAVKTEQEQEAEISYLDHTQEAEWEESGLRIQTLKLTSCDILHL